MGAGHAHTLYLQRSTAVHALAPHCKIVAVVGFVVAVVLTPRGVWWPYAVAALALVVVAALARIPAATIARRMVIETPFVLFAVVFVFVAPGPTVDVAGVGLSREGLVAAGGLLAKATLGVVASILLAATTSGQDLVRGLRTLRLPTLIVTILTFMIRYAEVIADEMRRMRIARESRAFAARHLGHLRVIAGSAGALFIRAYERGERVHLAMLARGYTGTLPVDDSRPGGLAGAAGWSRALALPLVAAAAVGLAWLVPGTGG